jgi:transcriptional regulator with XRE-family HTH domain
MDEDFARVRSELARGRRATGLSLERVAAASGVSASTVGRIESGAIRCPDLRVVAGIAACAGLDVRLRAYPAGDAIRDAGQQRLLDRLRGNLHADLRWTTEVPLPIDGDLRAWDAVIGGDGWSLAVEAETVLDDIQAVERRLNLKLRDGGIEHVILLVAETRANRAAVDASSCAFPGLARQARSTLRALRHGVDPGRSSIVLL